MDLKVLQCGNCERLKLGVHAAALGIATLCGVYNAAAWLSRRDRHLAINAVLYAALVAFEQRHVVHHIAELRRPDAGPDLPSAAPAAMPVEPPRETAIAA